MTSPASFLLEAEEARALTNEAVAKGLDAHFHFGAFNDQSRLVGFVTARRGGAKRMRHMADIGPLYVTASAQRQGHARALMEAAMEELRGEGVLQVELCVDEENSGARALYSALGFIAFGRRPRSVLIGTEPRHAILMIRALDGADLSEPA